MNLGEILTAQEQRGFATDTRTARTEMTNSVERRVCNLRRWPFLKVLDASGGAVVAGTSTYDLETALSDIKDVDALRLDPASGDGIDLSWLDNEQFRELQHTDSVRGVPQAWTSTDKRVYLYPTPADAYTLRVDYIRRPTAMNDDADEPTIPVDYHDLLVWGGIVEMTFRERDATGRREALDEFDPRLLEMMHQYGMVQRQTSARVISSGFYEPYDYAEELLGVGSVWSR